jgi:hypothetical protein
MDLERSDVERLVRVEQGVSSLQIWSVAADAKLDALILQNAAARGVLNGLTRIAPWVAILLSIAVAVRGS